MEGFHGLHAPTLPGSGCDIKDVVPERDFDETPEGPVPALEGVRTVVWTLPPVGPSPVRSRRLREVRENNEYGDGRCGS